MSKDPIVEITPSGYRVNDTEVTNGDAFVTKSPQDLCPYCYLWGVEPQMLTEGMVFRIESNLLATIEFGPIPELMTAVKDIARLVNITGAPWHQLQISWTHKPAEKDLITFLIYMVSDNPVLAGVFKPVIATDHEGGWQFADARIPAFSEDLLNIYRIYECLGEAAGWYNPPESGILVSTRTIWITPEGVSLRLLRDSRWTKKPRCSFSTTHMARINRVLAERAELEGQNQTPRINQVTTSVVEASIPTEEKELLTYKPPGAIPVFLKAFIPSMVNQMAAFDPENAEIYREIANVVSEDPAPRFLTIAEAYKTPLYCYMDVPLEGISAHLNALQWKRVASQTNCLMMGSHKGLMTDFYGGLYMTGMNNELLNVAGGDVPLHLREVVEVLNVTNVAGRYTNVFWKNHGFYIEPSPFPVGVSVLSAPLLIYESSLGQAYMYDGKHSWLIREKTGTTPEVRERKPQETRTKPDPEENVLLPQLLAFRLAPKNPIADLRNQAKENTPRADSNKVIEAILGNVDGIREPKTFSFVSDFHVIGSKGEPAQIEAEDLRYLEKLARERGMLVGDTMQLLPHGSLIERRGPMDWVISGR